MILLRRVAPSQPSRMLASAVKSSARSANLFRRLPHDSTRKIVRTCVRPSPRQIKARKKTTDYIGSRMIISRLESAKSPKLASLPSIEARAKPRPLHSIQARPSTCRESSHRAPFSTFKSLRACCFASSLVRKCRRFRAVPSRTSAHKPQLSADIMGGVHSPFPSCAATTLRSTSAPMATTVTALTLSSSVTIR